MTFCFEFVNQWGSGEFDLVEVSGKVDSGLYEFVFIIFGVGGYFQFTTEEQT